MKRFSSEASLAAVVVSWLEHEGWDVYQEVAYLGVCDLVSVRGPLVWAIETKLAFGTRVLEQACQMVGHAHLVSVATPPCTRGNHVLREYCEWRGLGWLEVPGTSAADVFERIPARLFRKITPGLRAALRPEHKAWARAGSPGGGHWTRWKETCRNVRTAVEARPGISLRELLDGVATHYRSRSGARAGIAYWAERGRIAGVKLVRRGRALCLYPAGMDVPDGQLQLVD